MAEKEVRTIMAPLTDGYVMLPNTAVGEILAYSQPEPFKQGPPWLLGEIAWRGWQVPVINYEYMINPGVVTKLTSKARILIIKTLGESTQVNYIGLVTQGLPRLKKASEDTLADEKLDGLPDTVFSKVRIEDMEAVIPEIGDLTRTVELAAYDN